MTTHLTNSRKSPCQTRGTLAYFKYTTWSNINTRTVNGSRPRWNDRHHRYYLEDGVELRMIKEEFYAWCDSNAMEIMTIYQRGGTPSVDRISKHYSVDQIRVIDFRINAFAGTCKGFKNGALASRKANSIPIVATHLVTKESISFQSIMDAVRQGFDKSTIIGCLKGKFRSHNGYKWCRTVDRMTKRRV